MCSKRISHKMQNAVKLHRAQMECADCAPRVPCAVCRARRVQRAECPTQCARFRARSVLHVQWEGCQMPSLHGVECTGDVHSPVCRVPEAQSAVQSARSRV